MRSLRLDLASFGYTNNAPEGIDLDSIFDCRALPNPKSNRSYKSLTGEDVGLQQAIFDNDRGRRTLEAFVSWVDVHAGRARHLGSGTLSLFVGCKSGQHRSVALVCRFARLREVEAGPCETTVVVSHRDRDRWVTTALMQPCDVCRREVHRDDWLAHVGGKKHQRQEEKSAKRPGAAEAEVKKRPREEERAAAGMNRAAQEGEDDPQEDPAIAAPHMDHILPQTTSARSEGARSEARSKQ